jgi:hypothetical protein
MSPELKPSPHSVISEAIVKAEATYSWHSVETMAQRVALSMNCYSPPPKSATPM